MFPSVKQLTRKTNILQNTVKGCFCINAQQTRNTVMVERVYPMGNRKEGRKPHYKDKHFLYRVIEPKSYADAEVDCILIKNSQYGQEGEVKTVKANYFRRVLFPYLAVYACDDNLRDWDHVLIKSEKTKNLKGTDFLNALKEERIAEDLSVLDLKKKNNPKIIKQLVETLSSQHLLFPYKEDAEVTKSVIRVELRKRGIHVPLDAITFVDGPISALGDYIVCITVNGLYNIFVRTSVVKNIHQYSQLSHDPLKAVESLYCTVSDTGEVELASEDQIKSANERLRLDVSRIVDRTEDSPGQCENKSDSEQTDSDKPV